MAVDLRTVKMSPLSASLGPRVCASIPLDDLPPVFIESKAGALDTIDDVAAWVTEQRPELDRLIIEHGAIVLRGFPVRTSADFATIVACFPAYEGNYKGGAAARRPLDKGVYEATQRTGEQTIQIHQEMFYVRDYPPRLAFFARKVAEKGGETIIADMRRVSANIPEKLRERFASSGILTVRNFAPPTGSMVETELMDRRGWDFAFYTDSREEVNEVCAKRGMEPHWHDDNSLTVYSRLPAFVRHPVTGEMIYRSAIHTNPDQRATREKSESAIKLRASQKIPSDILLGNGEALNDEEETAMLRVVDDATIAWQWETGDLMIVDNLQIGHGRNPFVGERATDVAMMN